MDTWYYEVVSIDGVDAPEVNLLKARFYAA